MAFKSYKTNAICPRCGTNLYTQDYLSDYPLCCPDCCEDFLFIENALYTNENPNPVFKVFIPMSNVNITDILNFFDKCFEICPKLTGVTNVKDSKCLMLVFNNYSDLMEESEKICFPIRNIGRYVEKCKEYTFDDALECLERLYEYHDKMCKGCVDKDTNIILNKVDHQELEESMDTWIEDRKALEFAIEKLKEINKLKEMLNV